MKFSILSFLLAFLLSSIPVVSQASGLAQKDSANDANTSLSADLKKQQLDADLAFLIAPIKSRADINEYLQETAKSKSPLHLLSKTARARFLKSLTFNDAGLTGFSYADLEANLTPSQIYQVLALFGSQNSTPMIKNVRVESELDAEILTGDFGDSEDPAAKCFIEPGAENGPLDPNAPRPKETRPNGDRTGYNCSSRATCSWAVQMVCKANC